MKEMILRFSIELSIWGLVCIMGFILIDRLGMPMYLFCSAIAAIPAISEMIKDRKEKKPTKEPEFSSDEIEELKIKCAKFGLELPSYLKKPSKLSFIRMLSLSGFINNVRLVRKLKNENNIKIAHPPGYKLFELIKNIYTEKTYKRVYEPILENFQHEYYEALAKRQNKLAFILHLNLYVDFCKAAGLHHVVRMFRSIFSSLKIL